MSTIAVKAPEQDEKPTTPDPLRAAQRPVAAGVLTLLGVLWSLLVIALAVVCIRDTLVALGALGGEPWIKGVTDTLDGTTATNWIFAIGVACALLGLLLLWAAVKPRPRRGIEIEADTGVLVSKPAVRRLASSAAREVDGVDMVSVTASRKTVTVDAAILPGAPVDEVRANISEAVTDRLSALRERPEIRVRTNGVGG